MQEDLAGEMRQLGRARECAVDEEVRNLKEAGACCELFDWIASETYFWISGDSYKRTRCTYLYRNMPLSPSMYVMLLSITAVLRKPRSATRKPRSVSSSGLSLGPAGARMPLKKVAGMELWEILHDDASVGVEIVRKRDVRDNVFLASTVVYNTKRVVSLELRRGEWFAHDVTTNRLKVGRGDTSTLRAFIRIPISVTSAPLLSAQVSSGTVAHLPGHLFGARPRRFQTFTSFYCILTDISGGPGPAFFTWLCLTAF